MSTDRFVQEIRNNFRVRPVLPFGLPLTIGTVGVVEDGQFSYRGTVKSILGVEPGETTTSVGTASWSLTSGRDVSIRLLASGEESTFFPQAPTVKARVEISLQKADSFLASVLKPNITTLKDPVALVEAMLNSYSRGIWRKAYVVVHEAVIPDGALVLLSRTANTKILLEANTDFKAVNLADLAAGLSVTYQNQDVLRFESGGGNTLFYNAFRVKENFWTGQAEPTTFTVADPSKVVFDYV